jgi:SAM-dependent methyltransferase
MAYCLNIFAPGYRSMRVHDVAPVNRGISNKLLQQCPGYVATNFFPDEPAGQLVKGIRNENIERQTFDDGAFDLVISLDVMEHVNRPDLACLEVARTLVSGGLYMFSTPTYKDLAESRRRALYHGDGSVELIDAPAEYHGNPISRNGSLVTFHYGYDLARKVNQWSAMDVTCRRFHNEQIGVFGPHTEIYICRKR